MENAVVKVRLGQTHKNLPEENEEGYRHSSQSGCELRTSGRVNTLTLRIATGDEIKRKLFF